MDIMEKRGVGKFYVLHVTAFCAQCIASHDNMQAEFAAAMIWTRTIAVEFDVFFHRFACWQGEAAGLVGGFLDINSNSFADLFVATSENYFRLPKP